MQRMTFPPPAQFIWSDTVVENQNNTGQTCTWHIVECMIGLLKSWFTGAAPSIQAHTHSIVVCCVFHNVALEQQTADIEAEDSNVVQLWLEYRLAPPRIRVIPCELFGLCIRLVFLQKDVRFTQWRM